MSPSKLGFVQKIEKLGTFDGPGIRTVFFLSGCPLRCLYCHNPETWQQGQGQMMSPDDVLKIALRYQPYYGQFGGVTFSGGEPLMQAEFVDDCFKLLKEHGFHTTLDTAGYSNDGHLESILNHTDLVLYDLKAADADMYHSITLGNIKVTDRFLDLTQKTKTKLWIRQVLVPGINDNELNYEQTALKISSLNSVEKIEVLPYHTLGYAKYEKLKIDYPLKGLIPMDMNKAIQVQESIIERVNELKNIPIL